LKRLNLSIKGIPAIVPPINGILIDKCVNAFFFNFHKIFNHAHPKPTLVSLIKMFQSIARKTVALKTKINFPF